MKISGPGSGTPADATTGASETSAQDATNKADEAGKAFADRLEAAAGTPEVSNPSGASALSEIAAGLESGQLTPQQAVDQVVQRIVTRQLGVDAPAAVREQLEALLRQTLEDDPVLSDKVRRLG